MRTQRPVGGGERGWVVGGSVPWGGRWRRGTVHLGSVRRPSGDTFWAEDRTANPARLAAEWARWKERAGVTRWRTVTRFTQTRTAQAVRGAWREREDGASLPAWGWRRGSRAAAVWARPAWRSVEEAGAERRHEAARRDEGGDRVLTVGEDRVEAAEERRKEAVKRAKAVAAAPGSRERRVLARERKAVQRAAKAVTGPRAAWLAQRRAHRGHTWREHRVAAVWRAEKFAGGSERDRRARWHRRLEFPEREVAGAEWEAWLRRQGPRAQTEVALWTALREGAKRKGKRESGAALLTAYDRVPRLSVGGRRRWAAPLRQSVRECRAAAEEEFEGARVYHSLPEDAVLFNVAFWRLHYEALAKGWYARRHLDRSDKAPEWRHWWRAAPANRGYREYELRQAYEAEWAAVQAWKTSCRRAGPGEEEVHDRARREAAKPWGRYVKVSLRRKLAAVEAGVWDAFAAREEEAWVATGGRWEAAGQRGPGFTLGEALRDVLYHEALRLKGAIAWRHLEKNTKYVENFELRNRETARSWATRYRRLRQDGENQQRRWGLLGRRRAEAERRVGFFVADRARERAQQREKGVQEAARAAEAAAAAAEAAAEAAEEARQVEGLLELYREGKLAGNVATTGLRVEGVEGAEGALGRRSGQLYLREPRNAVTEELLERTKAERRAPAVQPRERETSPEEVARAKKRRLISKRLLEGQKVYQGQLQIRKWELTAAWELGGAEWRATKARQEDLRAEDGAVFNSVPRIRDDNFLLVRHKEKLVDGRERGARVLTQEELAWRRDQTPGPIETVPGELAAGTPLRSHELYDLGLEEFLEEKGLRTREEYKEEDRRLAEVTAEKGVRATRRWQVRKAKVADEGAQAKRATAVAAAVAAGQEGDGAGQEEAGVRVRRDAGDAWRRAVERVERAEKVGTWSLGVGGRRVREKENVQKTGFSAS